MHKHKHFPNYSIYLLLIFHPLIIFANDSGGTSESKSELESQVNLKFNPFRSKTRDFQSLAENDPFAQSSSGPGSNTTVGGHQLTCNEAGIRCMANCGWIDWWSQENKTVVAPPIQEFSTNSITACFQRCANTSACTSFGFNRASSSCRLFGTYRSNQIRPARGWSFSIRIPTTSVVLREWAVTRDVRPRSPAFKNVTMTSPNATWVNCLDLCVHFHHPYVNQSEVNGTNQNQNRPRSSRGCQIAVYSTATKVCSLYSSYYRSMYITEPHLVTILHASVYTSSNEWRFTWLGAVAPVGNQTAVRVFDTGSIDNCLDYCLNRNGYLAVTRAIEDGAAITCETYLYLPVNFEGVEGPGPNNSFILDVPKVSAGLPRQQQPYVQIIGEPIIIFNTGALNFCWARLLEFQGNVSSPNATRFIQYFEFDSETGDCLIYEGEILGQLISNPEERNETNTRLRAYSTPIPTHQFPSFYAFDSFWTEPSEIGNIVDLSSGRQNDLVTCLQNCERSNCSGFIRNPDTNSCIFLNEQQMERILQRNITENFPTNYTLQVYQKQSDLRYLDSPQKYSCMSQDVYNMQLSTSNHSGRVTWEELLEYRRGLPRGNNAPLQPHDQDFSGQIWLPDRPREQLSSSQALENKKADKGLKLGAGKVLTVIGTGAAAGGAAGLWIGGGVSPVSPVTAAVGAGVGAAIAGVELGVYCLLTGCKDDDPVTCPRRCGLSTSSTSQFLALIREHDEKGKIKEVKEETSLQNYIDAPSCPGNQGSDLMKPRAKQQDRNILSNLTSSLPSLSLKQNSDCNCVTPIDPLTGQNEPLPQSISPTDAQLGEFDYYILQDHCHGTRVGRNCPVCCKVGWQPEVDLWCVCKPDQRVEWDDPQPRCVARKQCISSSFTWPNGVPNGQNEEIWRIPVTNCKNSMYYAVGFSQTRRTPIYALYKFHTDTGPDLGRANDFVAFPCTDRDLHDSQLSNAFYSVIGGRQWHKGHLAPHQDIRTYEDAVSSSFYYINAVPQDGFSNVAWAQVETRVHNLLNERLVIGNQDFGPRGGFIITGTCWDGFTFLTKAPSCIWKLVCTRYRPQEVTVAAFYHTNTPANTEAEKQARRREMYRIYDQSFLNGRVGPNNFEARNYWREAAVYYTQSSDTQFLSQCYEAQVINFPPLTLPTTQAPPTRDEFDWERQATPGPNDAQYALYFWWMTNLFGPDFDPAKGEEPAPQAVQSNSGAPPVCGKKVVGYVTGWSDVPFTSKAASYLTHAIFAFVEMHQDGSLSIGSADPQNSKNKTLDQQKSYLRLYEMKDAKAGSGGRLKTMFAVGGWENSQYFSRVIADPALTQNFIRDAIYILDYFDMDGVDIDFEYPVSGGATNGTAADKENYVKFLSTLRGALQVHLGSRPNRKTPYLLTIAGAAGAWVLAPGFDLPKIAAQVDWINVMTYDYYGPWTSQWGAYTGPIAPLFFGAPANYSGKLTADFTLKHYFCQIKDPEKIVMGVGFYGRYWNNSGNPVNASDPLWRKAVPNPQGQFAGGYLPWRNVFSYLNSTQYNRTFHSATKTPYLLDQNNFLLTYEDTTSISAKIQYAAAKNLGGVMIWAVDLDDPANTMLRTASSNVLCGGRTAAGGTVELGFKCPPISEKRWWTQEDGDGKNAGMCGRSAPLYNGFYPLCDPEDPAFGCCSDQGYCGSGSSCTCEGCVDYYKNPERMLDEPIRPSGPVRWLTLNQIVPGRPTCGYQAPRLNITAAPTTTTLTRAADPAIPICNPDSSTAFCCSGAGYCGNSNDSCNGDESINFKQNPRYVFAALTWIVTGPNRGKCGYNPDLTQADWINGRPPTCSILSKRYHCCSSAGYCGDACPGTVNGTGSVDFWANPNFQYPPKTWHDGAGNPNAGKCGPSAPQVNGQMATCNPFSDKFYCCSNNGFCGSGAEFCTCQGCVDYRPKLN